MKKITYILVLLTAYSFAQSKTYDIFVEDKKEVSSFYKFADDSFIVCTSKNSNSSKGNKPNLVRLDANLDEIYNITFEGFDAFFDYTNDGAMLNNYHFIPRTTSQKNNYAFIDKTGTVTEVAKAIISGGDQLKQPEKFTFTADKRISSDNVQFVIGNTQYALGRRSGKAHRKDEYTANDIYLYALNLETSTPKLTSAPSEDIAASLNFKRAHIDYIKHDDTSYSLLYRDNRERLHSDISVITYDLTGIQTDKVKIVTDLSAGTHFGNTKTFYDYKENAYYTYGLYHEHKDPNRKLAASKYQGYYIQKFDAKGTFLWKIQKPFMTDSFKDNQSQQDCLYRLDRIDNGKLLFSAGNTDETIFDELIIDKVTGAIDAEQALTVEWSTNGYPKNPLIIEQLSIPDTYGKNNFFNTVGLHVLSLNEEFSNYIKGLKDTKNKLHYKVKIVADGFVVLQSDLKSNTHKLLKFTW